MSALWVMYQLDRLPMKSSFRFSSLVLILLFLLSTSAWASGDVRDWLKKMQHAAHMVNYDGTFVYSQKDQLSAMRLIHRANKEGEQERLISLDSTGREVIRNNKKVTCVLPDSKSVVVEKGRPMGQFPPPFPSAIQALEKYYHFSLANREKVAGQLSQQIHIQPKDRYRYGHRLWVDVETGLLLQKHLLSETGKSLEKFMFTQIEYMDHIPDELLEPQSLNEEYTWYEADDALMPRERPKQQHQWQVDWLPKGFSQDMQRAHHMPVNTTPLEHMVFSDGLSSISVFIEPHAEVDTHLLGGSSMGAVSAYGRHVDGYHVTVVGEVPQIVVRKVCASVNKVKK